jgi:hypothetical protein
MIISFALNSPSRFSNQLETRRISLDRGLSALKGRLGLVRRFFRLFRFLDAFANSYNIFLLLAPPKQAASNESESLYLERALDATAAAFNGGYLFLETITIVDALGIPDIAIWGVEGENALKIESQRCWFFALVAGALANFLRLRRNLRQRRAHRVTQSEEVPDSTGTSEGQEKQNPQQDGTMARLNAERTRILRKMLACCLDLALPGSVIGWVAASPGTVGALMFVTSILTGLEVWERCGREVAKPQ